MTYREHLEEGLWRCTNLSQQTIEKAWVLAAPQMPELDEEYEAPDGVLLMLYWEILKDKIRGLQSHYLN